nr:RNA-directed DNA polymerase, eukaryota [Tanacetum cinerariifolium]
MSPGKLFQTLTKKSIRIGVTSDGLLLFSDVSRMTNVARENIVACSTFSCIVYAIISKSVHGHGLFKGISIGDGSVNLSHLFYADDAVFVGQWSDSNITTLVHVLECFHKLSGLRINMCKSKLMGLHVDGELVHRAARQLGCLVLNLPFSYLGLIVGDNMARQQAWGGIVDRVKKKLSKWKMKMLSIGARWWKVSIENFDCYDEWLEWIDSIRMSKKTKIMMEAVFYTSWWMVWWFRNSKIFKEKAPKKACFF